MWDAKQVTIDTETCDPDLREKGSGWATRNGFLVGVSVKADDFCGYYPIAHDGGGNLNKENVLRWLTDVCKADNRKLFFHALYDVGWLQTEGVTVNGPILDAMYGAPLLDENRRSYSLDNLSKDCTGIRKDESLLKAEAKRMGFHPKNELWKMPAWTVGPYAEGDCVSTEALWDWQQPRLQKDGLTELFELECKLIRPLLDMRTRGIRIDLDAAHRLKSSLGKRILAMFKEQREQFGVVAHPKSGKEIAAACKMFGIPYPNTASGAPSFKAEWLEHHTHPFIKHVHSMRTLETMQSLLEGIVLQYQVDGRIHCQLHSMRSEGGGAVTGRFSSSLPNLQQVPSRDPVWGPAFRSLFLPEKKQKLAKLDYSQQEFRLIVHYALLMKLEGAAEAARLYREEGADFHQIVADMSDLGRTPAKNLNFGIAFQLGKDKMARNLGREPWECEEIIERYHQNVPFMRGLSNACMNRANRVGYVKTILGRRRRFDLWEPAYHKKNARGEIDNSYPYKPLPIAEARKLKWKGRLKRAYTYRAMNAIIQGSGADMIKKAIADCYDAGLSKHLLLQVHDELPSSVPNKKTANRIKEVMEQAIPCLIPMTVDFDLRRTWGG